MCKPRIFKKSGQVLLETALVLISLSVLVIGSMRLFSNLNLNMTSRIEKYRQDRLNAVNGFATNPLNYLTYAPHDIIIGDSGGFAYFDPVFYDDPRLSQAALLLEEQDNLINIILPYKINQIYTVFNKFSILRVKTLANDTINLAERAYDDFYEDMNGVDRNHNGFIGAIGLFQQALDDYIEDGPFDPTPSDPDRAAQNQGNRDRIQSAIESLRSVEPNLSLLLNQELIPRLQDVRDGVGIFIWWIHPDHWDASRAIDELVNWYVGVINPSKLTNSAANKVKQIYDLLRGEIGEDVSYGELSRAKGLSLELAGYSEIADSSRLQGLADRLKSYLTYTLKYWDREKEALENGVERDAESFANLKEHYFALSNISVWAFYEITDINRM